MYNPATKTWTKLPDMNEPRSKHSLVLFQGLICAISGGMDRTIVSWKCFNRNTSKWSYFPKMIQKSLDETQLKVGAIKLNGELYIIGGDSQLLFPHKQFVPINTVRKYNLVNESWTEAASLHSPRSGIIAGVLNGKIYIVGGKRNVKNTVEIYDPSKNIWEQENELDFNTLALCTVF